MDLSLDEAAVMLGKSVRQVRYMIQQGRLAATKQDGRWHIDSSALPSNDTRVRQRRQQRARVRNVVDRALETDAEKDGYSVLDLRAVQVALRLVAECDAALAEGHGAAARAREVLEHLCVGCHRFERRDKASAYGAARDAGSRLVYELLLDAGIDPAPREALRALVEAELMPAMAGLLRRTAGIEP